MKTVNALKIRNHLGEVLDLLERTQEPILVSKGRKIRAALITPEQFKKRFLDFQSAEEQKKLLDKINELAEPGKNTLNSLEILRELRGSIE